MLAKAPQIMLFQYSDLMKPAEAGERKAWSGLETSFTLAGLEKWRAATGSTAAANYATVAGYSLATVNGVVGKLGKPIGIASYKPYQSTGEDFLHNYLGMIGVPIDLHPEFPADAKTVLLTESARFDPAIVSKIKTHLEQGGTVVITSGLLRALQGKGSSKSPRSTRPATSSKSRSTGRIRAGSGPTWERQWRFLFPRLLSRPTTRGRWCAARPTDAARRW